jgi:hypothetical protein
MSSLFEVFKKLDLNTGNGLFFTNEGKWKEACNFSSRVDRLLEFKIKPDAFFCFGNKPLILFYESPQNIHEIHKAIWNFNESPIVIFATSKSVEIYNGFDYIKSNEKLGYLGNQSNLNMFSYFELVTGNAWEVHKNNLSDSNRVDYHLLKNIKDARNELLNRYNLNIKISNALIGKIIFIRYLIDRNVRIGFTGENILWSNIDLIHLLGDRTSSISFFKYLQKKFNGDMFFLDDNEYDKITIECLEVLARLLNEESLESGQSSLFKLYDFSIIPVEFVSNVYESFIGIKDQEVEGAYYTPLFLVDYMLQETIASKFLKVENNYHCKVLDPACGSGIFLVESLRKIIDKYIFLHPESVIDTQEFNQVLKDLALENIYGIDKNISAIQVAIFSIQITLLDYQNPSSIENFRFPKLLNNNFFQADFFDTEHVFNKKLKLLKLDFIIGNPPWKGQGMGSSGYSYLNKRKKIEDGIKKYKITVNNGEIAEGFILRVSDFCTSSTQVSFIIRSTILYNIGYSTNFSKFRRYWLEEFSINKVFELAPVRKEVFNKSNDPAIAPAAIIFYKYANGANTDQSLIEHISLKPNRFFSFFKILSISRYDSKEIEQHNLKKYDWLWKTLVYGTYLDFNLISKLKNNFSTVKKIITNKARFIVSTGIHSRSFVLSMPKDTTGIKQLPFIKTDAVSHMFINYEKITSLDHGKVDIVKDERIYKAPMLLIREGIDLKNLTAKCAISEKDIVFKDSITSIKALDSNDINILKNLNAIYNSSFFSYLSINTFSSIGIERERVKNYNKFSIPYIDCDLEDHVTQVENLKKRIFKEENKIVKNNILIEELENKVSLIYSEIDKVIYNNLNINEHEKALIDYTLDITRPIIIKNKNAIKNIFKSIPYEAEELNTYASLFLDRFQSNINDASQKFIIEIWHTKYIIGMLFKVVPNTKEFEKSIYWLDKKDDTDILPKIIKLSTQKITDNLFVQKDLRGFEKDSFYIFKPNERKLWHKAIGILDVNEFMDAILEAGKLGV